MESDLIYICAVFSEQGKRLTKFSTKIEPQVGTSMKIEVEGIVSNFEVIDVHSQRIGESKSHSVIVKVRPAN